MHTCKFTSLNYYTAEYDLKKQSPFVKLQNTDSYNFCRHTHTHTTYISYCKLPGVKRPAIGVAPVWAANFSTARWPKGLEEMTKTSAGCSMAAMALAANKTFSQVRRKLMMCTPSLRTLYTYLKRREGRFIRLNDRETRFHFVKPSLKRND